MTAVAVAKKDFRDAVQSRALWSLVVVFVMLSVLSTYAYVSVPQMFGEPGGATFTGLIFFSVGLTGLFVPLAALVVCYKSLAGERELGSIKLLLSLPTTRRAVFSGKVLGRAAVLAFALGVGLLVGLGFGSILLGSINAALLIGFLLVSLGFAGVYAAIMVSLSAMTGSTTRATTFTLGFFVVFELFWDVIPLALLYVVNGFSLPMTMPEWLAPMALISPSSAYLSSISALFPELAGQVGAAPNVGAESASIESLYLAPELGIVILGAWFGIAVACGYIRFNTSDL